MRIAIYISAIILANVLTSQFAPVHIWGLLVPTGTFLIGFTFVLRDIVQMKYGKHKTYLIIGAALILSALSTYMMGNGFRIVFASAISFLFSETLDTEIFTRIKGSLAKKVAISGIAGSILDSIVFTLTAGFSINAALGQTVFKILMQGIGVLVLKTSIDRIIPGRMSGSRKMSKGGNYHEKA